MGMGILESKSLDQVPGTTRYFDDEQRTQTTTGGQHHGLKVHKTRGGETIILIPQPSDDPNDPLNWPLWRRDLITFLLSISAIFATSLGPILASNTIVMLTRFPSTDFTDVALMTGYFLLGVGAAAVFFVPSGRVWGKRHAFLLGLGILVASSAWAGAVRHNYGSFAAARVIQGVGCAPFETLVNAAVGDLYHVHERGIRMAFTNLAVFGGAFLTPVLVGKITHELQWWWTFNLVAIFCGLMLPAVFFLCPETAFRRDARFNTDLAPAGERGGPHGGGVDGGPQSGDHFPLQTMRPQTESASSTDPPLSESGVPLSEKPAQPGDVGVEAERQQQQQQQQQRLNTPHHGELSGDGVGGLSPQRPKPFAQRLKLVDGRKTDDSFWKLLLRPFPLFVQPAFVWACLMQGAMIGWTVFIGVILASIFIGPPNFWDEVQTGYTYVGPFLGAVLGFVLSGVLADWSAKFMTRRNKGIYEPEFRILLIIPMLVVGGMGMYGFGYTASRIISGQYHWTVPCTFFGLQVAGMVLGTVSSSLYIVDAYRDLAIEGFTMMIIFKNMFSFILTFYAYDWVIAGVGIRATMNIISTIQVGLALTSIPMYIYGKRVRAYFHQHDIVGATRLK